MELPNPDEDPNPDFFLLELLPELGVIQLDIVLRLRPMLTSMLVSSRTCAISPLLYASMTLSFQ